MEKRTKPKPKGIRDAMAPEIPDVEKGVQDFLAGFAARYSVNPAQCYAGIMKR